VTFPGGVATYTPVYSTPIANPSFGNLYKGAIQAVCINRDPAGIDTTSPPWFAFLGSNTGGLAQNLYTVSGGGAGEPALGTVTLPGVTGGPPVNLTFPTRMGRSRPWRPWPRSSRSRLRPWRLSRQRGRSRPWRPWLP
jgi:hypothetical protein